MKRLCLYFFLGIFLIAPQVFASTSYQKGLVFSDSEKNVQLKTNLQLAVRHRYTFIDSASDQNTFRLRLARLAFSGFVLSEDLKFKFVPSFDSNTAGILDAFVHYRVKPYFQVKLGQLKVPFSREYQSSSIKLSVADVSIVSDIFALNRDIGVVLYGHDLSKKFEYSLFTINGNRRAATNSNKDFAYGLRVNVNALGQASYVDNDFSYSDTPSLSFGAALAFDSGSDAAAIADNRLLRTTLDAIFRKSGIMLGLEGHYVRNISQSNQNFGGLARASVFIIPKRFELNARGAAVVRQDAGALGLGSVNSYETTLGANYYFHGQQLYLLFDFSTLWNAGAVQNQDDHRLRTQVNFSF